MNRKELASKLNMHPETLSKRLKEIGINGRELIWPKQLELIFDTIANPLYFKVTRLKLAKSYNIHPETFTKWLKEIGIRSGKRLSIEDIKKCYLRLGIPQELINQYPAHVKELRKQLGFDHTEPRKNID